MKTSQETKIWKNVFATNNLELMNILEQSWNQVVIMIWLLLERLCPIHVEMSLFSTSFKSHCLKSLSSTWIKFFGNNIGNYRLFYNSMLNVKSYGLITLLTPPSAIQRSFNTSYFTLLDEKSNVRILLANVSDLIGINC